MTTQNRITVFESGDVRVEIFRTDEGERVEAIVIYATASIGVLRLPFPRDVRAQPSDDDTLPSSMGA